jgi:hypothetical protein
MQINYNDMMYSHHKLAYIRAQLFFYFLFNGKFSSCRKYSTYEIKEVYEEKTIQIKKVRSQQHECNDFLVAYATNNIVRPA